MPKKVAFKAFLTIIAGLPFYLEFDNLGKKNLEFRTEILKTQNIYMLSSKFSILHKKFIM